MLKRQRPASPSPFYDATEDEKSLPEDLFEPMSKRRRYFAPSGSNSLSKEVSPSEDVEDEDEGQIRTSYRPSRREGVQEWQEHAGEYKEENAKLHDLHAEQRHRLLFSISHPTGCEPSIASHHAAEAAQRSESGAPSRFHMHDNFVLTHTVFSRRCARNACPKYFHQCSARGRGCFSAIRRHEQVSCSLVSYSYLR